jgi:hypothetical protein
MSGFWNETELKPQFHVKQTILAYTEFSFSSDKITWFKLLRLAIYTYSKVNFQEPTTL